MNLIKYYEELIKLYNDLKEANDEFLINNTGVDGFNTLVDLRTNLFVNIDLLREDLINDLNSTDLSFNYSSMELIELLKELPNHYPELQPYLTKVADSLQQLMISEKNTSEAIDTLHEDLKKQIQNTRKNTQTLNAYKPVTGYAGSYFIDSKK